MMYVIGFLAQAFFSARILFQWILSEKAKKVMSPSIFWILSILGAYLLVIYGWLRDDFSILLGQFISYYIYIWNLYEKGVWKKVHVVLQAIMLLTPVVALIFVFNNADEFIATFLRNDKVPLWLLVFGSTGQVIFTLRFVYQWIYSARRKESILPIGFWVISLIGSSVIISYGVFRLDPVLILGQAVGFVAYLRNIMIARNDYKYRLNESK
ncbi:lipid-A-disaccharide synthase N-terminal domain-containing protein [Bacteroides sedimenti]|uniref:Lauroyl acyltransferase n=1 Tax=Bacteroides sedimenti TaxID=2136147 RepID=A0ABN6ZAK9_9BACE